MFCTSFDTVPDCCSNMKDCFCHSHFYCIKLLKMYVVKYYLNVQRAHTRGGGSYMYGPVPDPSILLFSYK